LLGRERSIVTEISGTTRDAIDSTLRFHEQDVVLVDTAGLRRRSRITANVEFYSVLRTERAIRSADVVVLVLDAEQGLESQDIRVLMEAERMKKGLVIAVNKWDLLDKETNTARDYANSIRDRLKTLDYIPVLFISALNGQRVPRVIETALRVESERGRRIPTSRLNEVLEAAVRATHPPTYRNRHVKIKYATQVRVRPPVIAIFCNHPTGIREAYRRYLEHRFRDAFGFEGVPLTLAFKKK
jgi:GTP-binding protein